MFEITYNDSDTLQNFIDADKAYHGAIYDFTFEGRFIVYHFFVKDTARYVALDSMTGYGSEITRRRKDNLFDSHSYHSMTPMVLDSIKYTGDKRYLNVIVNNPLETIESIFRTILPEYGSTIQTMLDEVLKMRSLLNEIEEPLEEFNDKLFHELVKGIEINKQDEMTVTFLGGLKFTELI